jgi:hypothetical protein
VSLGCSSECCLRLRSVTSDVDSLVVGGISALSLAGFVACLRVSWVVDPVVAGEASFSTVSLARFLVRPRGPSVSFNCDCDCDCVVSVAYFALMARSLSMPDILVVARVFRKWLSR